MRAVVLRVTLPRWPFGAGCPHWLALCALAALQCGGEDEAESPWDGGSESEGEAESEVDGGADAGTPECVLTDLPAGTCATSGGECETDPDCGAGTAGTCNSRPEDQPCGCDYYCVTSEDCPPGTACVCDASVIHGACVYAECRGDSDCSPYGCGLTPGPCGAWRRAFYCHTAEDECVVDSDCPPLKDGSAQTCTYDRVAARWICRVYGGVCKE